MNIHFNHSLPSQFNTRSNHQSDAGNNAEGKMPDRSCHHAGCTAAGVHPAPQSKLRPKPYLWFCKQHIVVYNQQWDWYHGMTSAQIVDDQLADLTWRRPTFAMKDGLHRPQANVVLDDPLQLLYHIIKTDEPAVGGAPKKNNVRDPDAVVVTGSAAAALLVLELQNPVSLAMVKESYRRAAMTLHPDKAKTDSKKIIAQKTKEFQKINAAYQELKNFFALRK
ncbi:MAG: J domain-containing protein [Hydrotalea sp.]|nr:J domain-containing protein [Hydrotalea sp.]